MSLLNAPKEFLKLFNAGKDAAKQGNKTQAHDLFRQAIEIDPYHEQVWLWLASVVETDDDQRACFENVLELNPDHPVARRQLQRLDQKALRATLNQRRQPKQRPVRRRWALLLMVAVIIVALAASLLLVSGIA